MTVIEIRPHRWGWKVFEAQGVESVFPGKRQAMSYAEGRAWFRLGEIRIFDSRGNLEDCAVARKNDAKSLDATSSPADNPSRNYL